MVIIIFVLRLAVVTSKFFKTISGVVPGISSQLARYDHSNGLFFKKKVITSPSYVDTTIVLVYFLT